MRRPNRKSKIVCTIGPAVHSESAISAMINAGMDVARINFSHGKKEDHKKTIDWIRTASEKLGITVGILADIQGPKIRTGIILGKDGKEGILELKKNTSYYFVGVDGMSKKPGDGTKEKPINVSYPSLCKDLKEGDAILCDDGLIKFEVSKNHGDYLEAKLAFGIEISSNKGVNMPSAKLTTLGVTEKDWGDIQYCVEQNVDFIALSFVRTAKEVKNIRIFLEQKKSPTHLVAKIEKAEAIQNLDEIMDYVDALMVARGDLGVEIGNENVPTAQKKIITMARNKGKPVITATQMLMSMVSNPAPSRAEASDIANAIWDGTDAVMLSNETATGDYPIESIEAMSKIIQSAESWHGARENSELEQEEVSVIEAIDAAAVNLSTNLVATCMACLTRSGQSARLLAKFRPASPIFAFAENAMVRSQLSLSWGVYVVPWKEVIAQDYTVFDDMRDELQRISVLDTNAFCVMTAGIPTSMQVGTTNTIVVRKGK